MIFGRNRKRDEPSETESVSDDVEAVAADPAETDEVSVAEGEDAGMELLDEVDPAALREDGPFDFSEVDLSADSVQRLDLGSLVVTPWEGLGLQLQVNEASGKAQAMTAVWQKSGLEVALFAAPASGGLAAELREDLIEEAEQAGGNARLDAGPFGREVRRVLPRAGEQGQQLFHVSRIWFAEGPRWLLRASLMGEAALGEADDPAAAPFVEFFRNLVVRRGNRPMVPGEQIGLDLPKGNEG